MNIKFLTAAITMPAVKKPDAGEDMIEEVGSMLQELQQLHSLLDMRYAGFYHCVPYFFWAGIQTFCPIRSQR